MTPQLEKQLLIQDIIPDREIIKMKNEEFAGLEYEVWNIQIPLFGDRIQTLLENGFMVSVLEPDKVNVCRQLNPSPEKLHENNQFWKQLSEDIRRASNQNLDPTILVGRMRWAK